MSDEMPPETIWICPTGEQVYSIEDDKNTTPELQYIRRSDVMKFVRAVRKVVEEGVQETEGQYSSWKNNKCRHGQFGYEGCDQCTDEFLAKALAEFTEKHGVDE